MVEMFKVSDLEKSMIGKKVVVDGLVKNFTVRATKSGSNYGDFTLVGKEKEINCKIWGLNESKQEFFENEKYVRLGVTVGEYNSILQLVVDNFNIIPENELVTSDFKKLAPESVEGMVEELEGYLNEIEDEAVKIVVSNIYYRYKVDFIKWVAARGHHHNYETGLLYHTVSMLRLARYNIETYPVALDKDIMYGAIILHDIAKVKEYSDYENPEFTDIGKLMGHIFLSGAWIMVEVERLVAQKREEGLLTDFSKIKYLVHAVLAHHGKLEWGSPVVPQTIEAEIIHQIDMMDSRMNKSY